MSQVDVRWTGLQVPCRSHMEKNISLAGGGPGYVCVVLQCLGQNISSICVGMNMVEFDVPEIIYCKDSATGRTRF